MHRRGCGRNKKPFFPLIAFGAAVICLCLLSYKVFLFFLAITLIALGVFLLRH